MRDRPSEPDSLAMWLHEPSWHSQTMRALRAGRAVTSTVDGKVVRVDADHLWVEPACDALDADGMSACVPISHRLPTNVDLEPLLGQTVRATLVCDDASDDGRDRTLIVNGECGRVWLLARSGTVRGVTHTVSVDGDAFILHAALSQRPLGPLVIGTSSLQWLVPVGQCARMQMPDGSTFRAMLLKRRSDGTASYIIADERLFSAPPS